MTYNEALNYIHSRPRMKNLDNRKAMRLLLDMLGNPQDKLNIVHIAGTNGKGSTCAMIKTGKVRSNLMVNVRPTNEKLVERATRIIMQIADVDHQRAAELLEKYGDVPAALDACASAKCKVQSAE